MEKEAFQKRLEDLGELAKINNNRLSTDAVKTFLKDMDLTEEQYDLVFAYLASKMITVEGYVPAADQKEGTPELSEEDQIFLAQYDWSSAGKWRRAETMTQRRVSPNSCFRG